MPEVRTGGAALYFQDLGKGPPAIALHGFSETSDYWTAGGFADLLVDDFRLLPMDLRGHGRSRVSGAKPGFDVETLADDIDRLADALRLDRYCVLAHATGSVVALRHAMRRPDRLAGLVLTSAASATAMVSVDPQENATFFGRMAGFYARHDWQEILPRLRASPRPFLHRLDHAPDPEAAWAAILNVFARNDPRTLARFVEGFYVDPDPYLEGLRRITAPTLLVTAEYDELMTDPSRLIAENVPGVRVEHLAGVGHMTAVECPEALAAIVRAFLNSEVSGSPA